MESQLFWLAATLEVAISIRLVLRLRDVPRRSVTTRHLGLAAGQRKDSWLACATIWAVALSRDGPVHDALAFAGLAVLAWLFSRTVRRLRLLAGKD